MSVPAAGPDVVEVPWGTTWPSLELFRDLAADRRVIPVVRRLLADDVTPVGLYRTLAGGRPGTFILESAEVDGGWSRYSFVGVHSRATLTVAGLLTALGPSKAGAAPIVDGVEEHRMRVGCGSATIGMFAKQWLGLVDEVVVVDDHITGVLSEHQAGKFLGVRDTGIKMKGHRSTPGRYFKVAHPGTGWGGTDLTDPLAILKPFDAKEAWPGLRLLMVSTTGEHFAYYELDANLMPAEKELPVALKLSVDRIKENCEPALSTVLFMAGAGGSSMAARGGAEWNSASALARPDSVSSEA